jgi:hypothetical protein
METTHNIKIDNVNFEVFGDYEKADTTTGYKGGFSIMDVKINDDSVYQFLSENALEKLQIAVLEENY